MKESSFLLKAYYEALYEKLEPKKDQLIKQIKTLLSAEINDRYRGKVNDEKFSAYEEISEAFLDERLETYNPFGVQYLFDNIRSKEAAALELQLNWYDSRDEYEKLLEIIHSKSQYAFDEEETDSLIDEIISEAGAFPDSSIISTYKADPGLEKLPDFAVAHAIEKILQSS